MRKTFVGVLCVVGTASLAAAEQPSGSYATRVSIQTGLSTGSSDTGAAVGATVVQGLGGRAAVEAQAAWLDRGRGAEALSASAALVFDLRRGTEKAVPYLAVGGGMYRTSFDMGEPRFGGMGTAGMGVGPGYGTPGYAMPGNMPMGSPGATPVGPGGPYGPGGFGDMPGMYANRMMRGGMTPGLGGRRSFTDAALIAGGGVRIGLGGRAFVRPDLRAIVVTGDGDTHTVGLFTVSVGYRF